METNETTYVQCNECPAEFEMSDLDEGRAPYHLNHLGGECQGNVELW